MGADKAKELLRYKRYYEKNKEKRKVYNDQYRATHKESSQKYSEKYYADPQNVERARKHAAEWYAQHREKVKEKYQQLRTNPEYLLKQKIARSTPEVKLKLNKRQKEYRQQKLLLNPEARVKIAERAREYMKKFKQNPDNKKILQERYVKYYAKYRITHNSPEIKLARKQKSAEKRKTDILYKLGINIHSRILIAFKVQKIKRILKITDLLGTTMIDTKQYIEALLLPGMNWTNYTFYGWHVDHIVPVSSFDLTDLEQQKACFHYTNLRPLWYIDNLNKHATLPVLMELPTISPAYPYLVKFLEERK